MTQTGQTFLWGEDCTATSEQLHTALGQAPVLAYSDPQLLLIVDTNAINMRLGAVLSKEGENGA